MNKLQRAFRKIIPRSRPIAALQAHYGPINVAGAKRVAVFPELGLAYNRIKKNANSSTMILLQQLATGQIVKSGVAKRMARNLLELRAEEIRNIEALTLFVIIRNPYSRVLSAFLEKMKKPHYQEQHGRFDLTPEGFGGFLDWLDKGGLTGDPHWDLQVKLMALPLDKYDTVIAFETYSRSMRAFLEGRGLTVPPGALEEYYPSYQGHETNASSKLTQFYTPERAALVQRLYAEDFRALGYSTDFPDPLH